MKKIVLSGYYGFGNAGDEAMLESILQALRAKVNDAGITVISGNPKATAAKYAVKAVYIFDLPAIVRELRGADLLVSGGGSLLQNVTSSRSIYYYLLIIALGKLFSRKVMLFAQGIGPVLGILPRAIMRWVVNKTDYITVRDEGSYYELKEIGIVRPPVEITADAVLGMEPADISDGRKLLEQLGITFNRPLIAIAPRRWGSGTNYIKALAEAADHVTANGNADVVFIPMHFPADLKVCQECAALMRNKAYVLNRECSAQIFMSVIGNCSLLAGIRLHALIFAAIMNVPALGISYDPKIDRFMHSVGLKTPAKIERLNGLKLAVAIDGELADDSNSRMALALTMEALRCRALRNTELAVKLLSE